MNTRPRFEAGCSTQTLQLLEKLRQGNRHLTEMAANLNIGWAPDDSDPRRRHNCYARNLVCCYVSKVVDLSDSLLAGLERYDYLTYALCARSLIEIVATLRYYILHQYKPLLDNPSLQFEDMMNLLLIDERHLRGSRFDWESFLYGNYAKITKEAASEIAAKKNKKRSSNKAQSSKKEAEQVNVLTCIEKWAEQTQEVMVAYKLFCDLVHPNLGSNFLVASMDSETLYFTKKHPELVGQQIFEQSFPILLSSTMQPFGQYLSALLGTCWNEQEIV
jgi:hypothetical protein